MLWKTKPDGAYRCVGLIDGLAIKTPYLFNYEDLVFWWEKDGSLCPRQPQILGAELRGPVYFSERFGVSAIAMQKLGVFNAETNIDNKMFVDPKLARNWEGGV
jgi:hypothetical protein